MKAHAAMGLLHAGIARRAARRRRLHADDIELIDIGKAPDRSPAMAAVTGAVIAVGAAYVLRGPAKVEEASAAEG